MEGIVRRYLAFALACEHEVTVTPLSSYCLRIWSRKLLSCYDYYIVEYDWPTHIYGPYS